NFIEHQRFDSLRSGVTGAKLAGLNPCQSVFLQECATVSIIPRRWVGGLLVRVCGYWERKGAPMRRLVCAGVVTLVAFGISLAADYNGTVVEVSKDGKSITILTGKKKGQEGTKKTFKVADNVVVKTGKVTFDKAAKKANVEEGDAIQGGLT